MINIGHPAHVHFFRHFIRIMEERGHSFLITAREKEVTLDLLRAFGIPHVKVSHHGRGKAGKATALLQTELELLRLAKVKRPDAILGISNMYGAHVAKFLSCPSFVFTDTERAALENSLSFPFATKIVVPSCYKDELRKYEHKTVRYLGCHELAYLHPARFTPNPNILEDLGLAKGERYAVVRFISWAAAHDAGQRGLTTAAKKELIVELSARLKVFISSEGPLPPELAPFKLNQPPERMHDVLALASVYVGEGATMASEAAVLGVPAVYVNPISAGTLEEFENRYGLLVGLRSSAHLLETCLELIDGGGSAGEWKARRGRMLADKIDVTKFMLELVEREMAAP